MNPTGQPACHERPVIFLRIFGPIVFTSPWKTGAAAAETGKARTTRTRPTAMRRIHR